MTKGAVSLFFNTLLVSSLATIKEIKIVTVEMKNIINAIFALKKAPNNSV